MTAATALARFVADLCRTTDPVELQVRRTACDLCPLKSERNTCNACGCNLTLKQSAPLEHCPVYRWQPAVRPVRPLDQCRRNLIIHLWPTAATNVWQRAIDTLAGSADLFNGQVIISVARSVKGQAPTVPTEDVAQYITQRFAHRELEIIEVINSPSQGEGMSFRKLLEAVRTTDTNDVTFYCHGKGVKYVPPNPQVERWRDIMFRVLLDWHTVQHALERFSIAGAFRRYQGHGVPWHYSGTFFWFRHDDLFSKPNWHDISKLYYGVEQWPGKVFRVEESACLFGDGVRGESTMSPYEPEAWEKQIKPLLTTWEIARDAT